MAEANKIKVERRRLTFADRLREVDESIATAIAKLKKLQDRRAKMVADESAMIESDRKALEDAIK